MDLSYRHHHQWRTLFPKEFNGAIQETAVPQSFPMAQTEKSAPLMRH
jgi:hypothetical protein